MQTKQSKTNKSLVKTFQKLNKPHKGPIEQKNSDGYIFELENVTKKFCNGFLVNDVLKGISLKIKKGKFVVILGKSGSGKTTLMNILSALSRASTGSVIVNNYQLINMTNNQLTDFRSKYVGYIFQEYGLLTTLNVYDNILTGFNLNKTGRDKKEIDEIINLVGLQDHKKKYPSELSGGQQQRVSIARAVAKRPLIIFGDEPTGAVDSSMSKKILKILKDVNKKYNTTIVLITHDKEIAKIAEQVIIIENGLIKQMYENKNPLEIV
ncbi:MAG: ABC transporter ATP-binding protein [Malacoplasma sp.]|nr:ABC transporter ATP-binding protein [Malacoplasma sp.]